MSYNTQNFVNDLEKAPEARKALSNMLTEIRDNLTRAESFGSNASGKLGLDSTIHDLSVEIDKLNNGIFKLLVLGEMKRGKSTFLNALLGEKDLLPTDVNPCTAILTFLSYGQQKKVTVYFKKQFRRSPEVLDFNTFKERYTIKQDEADKYEKEEKEAFPEVDYARVEYPLEILSKGVEIVDTPGLNDTKNRDEITLDYIASCHAILFVLSATQQFNQTERDYLRNRIQGRGLAVFFLINCWDEIQQKMIDPDDPKEVSKAKQDVRRRFDLIISEYLKSDNRTDDGKCVFEISSRDALRCKIRNQSLDGTGFPELTETLVNFLNNDRLKSELYPAVITSQKTQEQLHKAIKIRIPLLSDSIEKLDQKIRSVQPLFNKLTSIKNSFDEQIKREQERSARQISESFEKYVKNLKETFNLDFIQYQPTLEDNTETERKKFLEATEKAFTNYLQDKISNWNKLECDPLLKDTHLRLSNATNLFLPSYIETTDQITTKLLADHQTDLMVDNPNTLNISINTRPTSISSGSITDIKGIGSGIGMGLMSGIGGGYLGATAGMILSSFIPALSSTLLLTGILAPMGILAILGGIWGAKEARKDNYIIQVNAKLREQIPGIATEKSKSIYNTVKDTFSSYLKIVQQMDNDITSQQQQLNNLFEQKRKNQINIETEKKRLSDLENTVTNISQRIVRFYQNI